MTSSSKGDPVFSVNTSRGFAAWLKQAGVSLAVTTYQVGKLSDYRAHGSCLRVVRCGNECSPWRNCFRRGEATGNVRARSEN